MASRTSYGKPFDVKEDTHQKVLAAYHDGVLTDAGNVPQWAQQKYSTNLPPGTT